MIDEPGILVGWAYPAPWIATAKLAAAALVLAGTVVLYSQVRRGRALRGLGVYALFGLAACVVLGNFFYVAADIPPGEAVRLVLAHVVVPNILPLWLAAATVTLAVAHGWNRAAPRR